MNKIIYLLLVVSSLEASSFSKSKKILLKNIYFDNQNTFYCNNPYEIKQVGKKQKALIIKNDEFYTPRREFTKKGKINQRALRIEWEHIMPAYNFARHLQCWKDGGRKACKKDKTFKKMEADMYNLVPAIGEVNGDRSNYKFSNDKVNIGQYGNCEVQVNFKEKRVYVKDDIKGDIARAYFYMSETYNIRLSKKERKMFEIWDKQDPITSWEILKNKRISKYQKD